MSIVVCTPGGPAGDVLVEAGEEQARHAGSSLVLLRHVKLHDLEHVSEIDREMAGAAEVRRDLEVTARTIGERGIPCRAEVVTSGADNPSDELLDAARAADASLLVIGIRSRSRVGKLLLGSTAQDLLLAAGRPVLCVPVPSGR